MAKIANNYSKKIYVTDDNPRKENPKKIRNEILTKINSKKCFNIANRTLAIKKAIINSEQNEVILIAGKGHEEKQIYKNKTFYISDRKIVKKIKAKIKVRKKTKDNYLQNKQILKKITGIKVENFEGLAIDSRLVKKNNLFVTIKGKNNDAVSYTHLTLPTTPYV